MNKKRRKYKLILKEPNKPPRVIYEGTKKECEIERLRVSFRYNTSWLKVVEHRETEKDPLSLLIFGAIVICYILTRRWTEKDTQS